MKQQEPTISQIEAQLRQRVAHYPPAAWGRKQNDAWDKQTNFIYHTLSWADLNKAISLLEKPVADYAINRWFNFWSAQAVERIFCALPGVKANTNQYDRLVDFSIQGINFDHKTSVFPQKYSYPLAFAQNHKAHLIRWLYNSQSRQQRYHAANRLFIILYASNGEHWQLRAEITGLQQIIAAYIADFNPSKLLNLTITESQVLSDIIWFVK